jgi:nitrogen fixation-related uncharacterized protein
MTKIAISALVLAVGLLLWATVEVQYQRDFYKYLYCVEATRENPDHPVCGEE